MAGSGFSPQDLGTLLAVVVAVYAILIQVKRSRLSISSILFLFVAVGLVLLVSSVAPLITATFPQFKISPPFSSLVRYELILFVFSIWIISLVLRDIAISLYFRTESLLFIKKSFQTVGRQISMWLKIEPARGNYRKSTATSEAFLYSVFRWFFYLNDNDDFEFLKSAGRHRQSISILSTKATNYSYNKEVAELAYYFLDHSDDTFVQYVSCTRHPVEFVEELQIIHERKYREDIDPSGSSPPVLPVSQMDPARQKRCVDHWQGKIGVVRDRQSRLILVDAHSPHFGFDEPQYHQKSREARNWARAVVRSGNSYPGIHSAIVKAFKKIGGDKRRGKIGLIIYEDLSALSDIDSKEQFRLFVRHVVASERLMAGILTVFYEESSAVAEHPFLPDVMDRSFDFHKNHDVAYAPWEIRDRIRVIAGEIRQWADLAVPDERLLLCTVMNGGRKLSEAITSELKRLYGPDFDSRIESCAIKASAYGKSDKPRKKVRIETEMRRRTFDGRTVLLIDDIVHRGATLEKISVELKRKGAKKVQTVVAIQRAAPPNYQSPFFLFRYDDRYAHLPKAWLYGFGMNVGGQGVTDEQDERSRETPCFLFHHRG